MKMILTYLFLIGCGDDSSAETSVGSDSGAVTIDCIQEDIQDEDSQSRSSSCVAYFINDSPNLINISYPRTADYDSTSELQTIVCGYYACGGALYSGTTTKMTFHYGRSKTINFTATGMVSYRIKLGEVTFY
ncbi:MAG: hypothetical protein LBH05_07315 [Deferribacteraceae bacterium]|nr:hypothetical protein [Deferribacteraceae bacterium]